MRLKIIHATTYRFESAVFFEPHRFRLKPRIMSYSHLESYELEINPVPAGCSEQTDAENNMVRLCWFEDKYLEMNIIARSVILLNDYNPFDFIVYPSDYMRLPFAYSGTEGKQLSPSLIGYNISETLQGYCAKILQESEYMTIPFLTNLTRQIHEDFKVITREVGEPHHAKKTFRLKQGSCRDLAWMQVQMLRYLGIASRFVSGYCYIPGADNSHELHAWLESYLPGAGWIGMDPSHGALTGNTYIPLASSIHYDNAMPVSGTIRGGSGSNLKASLSIELL